MQDAEALETAVEAIAKRVDPQQQSLLLLLNKTDLCPGPLQVSSCDQSLLPISAKTGEGLDLLRERLVAIGKSMMSTQNAVLVTNVRHFEALKHAGESLQAVQKGLEEGIPTDLVAQDLREALYYLGSITGEITTDEVLGSIFSRFCIGK